MEHSSLKDLQGWVDDSGENDVADSVQPELHKRNDLKRHQSVEMGNPQITKFDTKDGTNVREEVALSKMNAPGDMNTEVSISADDVMRAGGFGARDDMGSFLPVASDFTDFEASLLDAREYEEPQQEIRRPGLGWTEAQK